MAVAIEDVPRSAAAEVVGITPAGTSKRMWIAGAQDSVGNSSVTPAATFNGEGYTELESSDQATGQYLAVFQSNGQPSSTTANADMSGSTGAIHGVMALALSGVDQTTPSQSVAKSEGNDQTFRELTISSAVGRKVVAFFTANFDLTATLVSAGDGTMYGMLAVASASATIAIVVADGAASVTIRVEWTGGNSRATLIAFDVPADSGGGGGSGHGPLLGQFRNHLVRAH